MYLITGYMYEKPFNPSFVENLNTEEKYLSSLFLLRDSRKMSIGRIESQPRASDYYIYYTALDQGIKNSWDGNWFGPTSKHS